MNNTEILEKVGSYTRAIWKNVFFGSTNEVDVQTKEENQLSIDCRIQECYYSLDQLMRLRFYLTAYIYNDMDQKHEHSYTLSRGTVHEADYTTHVHFDLYVKEPKEIRKTNK